MNNQPVTLVEAIAIMQSRFAVEPGLDPDTYRCLAEEYGIDIID